jgi:hypothetical protein
METIIFSVFIMILAHNLNKRLLIENLALRQQLMVMRLMVKRPKIRKRDRLFWVILSRLWKGWKNPLVVVQPETVIRWHRKGFKLFWTLKSRKNRTGRPPVDSKTRQLIKDMASAGCNEAGEQSAEDSNGGSALLGFAFPNLETLVKIPYHC